jgi:hypothetical protein
MDPLDVQERPAGPGRFGVRDKEGVCPGEGARSKAGRRSPFLAAESVVTIQTRRMDQVVDAAAPGTAELDPSALP